MVERLVNGLAVVLGTVAVTTILFYGAIVATDIEIVRRYPHVAPKTLFGRILRQLQQIRQRQHH